MCAEAAAVQQMLPFLERVIDAMSEAVLVIDRDATVVAANRAAIRLFDLPDREAALRPIDEYDRLIGGWRVGDQDFAPENLRRALRGQTIPRQLATITTSTGQERIMEFTATPIRDEEGRVILAMMVAEDVTAEQRLRGYWKAVGSAAQGLSTSLDVNEVMESVLDQMVGVLGAEVVIGIWRLDVERNRLEFLIHRGLSERAVDRVRFLPVDCDSFICEVARRQETQYVEDLRRSPSPHEMDRWLAEEEGFVSWLSAPLLSGGRFVGVVAYGARVPRRFHELDRRAIEVVDGLFAVAIDHAFLYRESRAAERELQQTAEEVREANQQLLASGLREQALAEEADRKTAQLNALLENQAEGVVIAESTGRIVLVNRAAREMFGWPEGKVPRTVGEFRQADLRRPDGTPLPFEERPVNRALRGERFMDYETLLVRPDGEERRILFSGSGIGGDRAGNVLAIAIYRDVTEVRRLEQAKTDYLSIISHDLRNPLTAIMGFAQLLLNQLEKKGLKREAVSAERVLSNARSMNSMIQDLVESARLEAGKIELAKEPVDLNALVSDVAERTGTLEDQRRLQVEAAEKMPALALDPARFERALVNLVTNALKYSPADRPVVVRVERRDGEAVVSVIDQGVGIPKKEIPHLFARYYRARGTEKTEGLGLGLYITRQIVEALGGRVRVESKVGKGSEFSIVLPLPPATGS